MTRITVVIKDHAEGIHLGQQVAGGRVVSVQQGDHSELLEVLEAAISSWEAGLDVFGVIQQARAAITKART